MTDPNARPSVDAGAEPETPELSAQPAEQPIDPADLARVAAEYKDKLLRTLAEMENLRRRTEREIADTRLYGISAFARDILAVADNMERALGALDAELREKADAGTKALLDGVELTERELLKVLEKHGVKKFEPLGEKFDPNLHQAMFEMPDPSRPAGTRRPGGAARLHDRRARAAAGAGGGRQRRSEAVGGGGAGERQRLDPEPARHAADAGGEPSAPRTAAASNSRQLKSHRIGCDGKRRALDPRQRGTPGAFVRRVGDAQQVEGTDDDPQHRPLPDHPYRQPAAARRPHPHDVRQGGGRAGRAARRWRRACARRWPRWCKRQVDAGIDIVNDGEMSKPSYATYVKDRLAGFGGTGNTFVYQDLADFPNLAKRVFGDPGRSRRKTPACNAADRRARPRCGADRRRQSRGRARRRRANRRLHERGVARRRLALLPQRPLPEPGGLSVRHRRGDAP